jgi:hypothetical protein
MVVLFSFLTSMMVSHLYGSPSNSVTRAEAGPSQAAVGASSNACAKVEPNQLFGILFLLRKGVLESEDVSRLSCCSKQVNEAVCSYRCEKPVQLLDPKKLECDPLDYPEKMQRVFDRALKTVKTLTVGQDVLVCMNMQSSAHLSELTELSLIFSDADFEIKNELCAYQPACTYLLVGSLKRVILSFDSTRYTPLIGRIVKKLPKGLQELKFVCGDHDSDTFDDPYLENEGNEPTWKSKLVWGSEGGVVGFLPEEKKEEDNAVELDKSSIRDFTSNLGDLPSSVKKFTVLLTRLSGFKSLADVYFFIQQINLLPKKNLSSLTLGTSGWTKSHALFLEGLAASWGQFNEVFESLEEVDLRITGGVLESPTFRRLAEGFASLGSKSVRVVKISLHCMQSSLYFVSGHLQEAEIFLQSFNSFPSCVKELHLCFSQWADFRFESQLLTRIATGFEHNRRQSLEKLFLKIAENYLVVSDFDFFGKNLGALPHSLGTLVFDFSPRYILSPPNGEDEQLTDEVGPAEVVDFIAYFGKLPKNLRCLKFHFAGSSEHFEDKDRRKVKGARISEALRQIPSFLDEIEIIITFDHKTVITKENLQQKIESFSLLQDEDIVL